MNELTLTILKEKISNSGYKVAYIADKLGISRPSLLNRLSGRYPFTISEAGILREILKMTNEETLFIFFGVQVHSECT